METTGKVIPVAIEDEIKESYLNYAMSVIVSRALPDVRDGLKPIHRRILYTMNEMGLRHDREFKKCGRIVGDVLGKYHPHGDMSIYEALVRMAQDFSLRYPVVHGQGNFGSIDGDPPAAVRYTEAKMFPLTEEMLRDIRKETVDFGPNYDDSLLEPKVLPAYFPFLLVNGGSGIAVGMATNIPPHNLREVSDAICAVIDNPKINISEIMHYMKGPDFPTGGIIFGKGGIRKAYATGRGKIVVRAKCVLEETKSGRDVIIVNELPYAVNKANLVMKIADLVKDKKIDGISDLRDESDRNGMRIVIELRKGTIPKVILNQLFSHTALQSNFNVNYLALVDGMPRLLNIKETIEYFIKHRKEVVVRRSKYDLKKALERGYILEGLQTALLDIDEIIRIIKASANVNDARQALVKRFEQDKSKSEILKVVEILLRDRVLNEEEHKGLKLSLEDQAQAILDMRLQKLTNLETQKIIDELKETMDQINYLKGLLLDDTKIMSVIKEETLEISAKFGDDRRTQIVADEVEEINIEDMIQKEDMAVVISNRGYIKRIPVKAYKNQGRGGKGSSSANLRDEDFVEHLFIASTHDYILFVTNAGKAYWLKVHEIPEAGRTARGAHMKSVLAISADEDITAVVSLSEFSDQSYIFMATSRGIVKKVTTSSFSNARTRGIIALKLDTNDKLVSALLTHGNDEIILLSRSGNALRYSENCVRGMGRASRGVTGIKLSNDDELAAVMPVLENEKMLIISEYGYGKRTDFSNFTPHGRGTRGQMAYKTNAKTGEIINALTVKEEDELVCISSQGNAIRLNLNEIPVMGKAAFGVRIVNIVKPDVLVGMARLVKEEDE
ncbi:MAG: DNA topoisomerase (ATP-hydrolyzing) subunit A [Spirochaetales bacterium]|nr:DNA topoisomerase (ATP-hydrolyzing) subunit A [Spirochaetales bacterium]